MGRAAPRGGRALSAGLARRPWLRWLLPVAATVLLMLALSPGLAGLGEPSPARGVPTAGSPSHEWPDRAPETRRARPVREAALRTPLPDPEFEPLPDDGDAAALERRAPGPDPPADADAYDCIIEPSERVEISSPVEGLIRRIAVERSDLVETGQTVVELESDVERAQVKLARARAQMVGSVRAREAAVALQQRREDRVGRLYASNALSLDLRDQVETEAEIARRELEEARDARRLASLEVEQAMAVLSRREIRSPVAGVVVDRLMSPGEVVDHETILVVAQVDPLRVEVILPAALFGTVTPGARAAVEPELPGDRVYVASVDVVDRVIDAASGTFGVWLELPNPEYEIPGGLNCRVRFLAE
jgi:RND family efflux transporter MFP subunit